MELRGRERCRPSPHFAKEQLPHPTPIPGGCELLEPHGGGCRAGSPCPSSGPQVPHTVLVSCRVSARQDLCFCSLLLAQVGSAWQGCRAFLLITLCLSISTVFPECLGSHCSSLADWLCVGGMSPGHHLGVLWVLNEMETVLMEQSPPILASIVT